MCYKNLENLTSIDLLLTNQSQSFQSSWVFEPSLLDFHIMTVCNESIFQKLQPRIIDYMDYSHFQINVFREELYSLTFETSITKNINRKCQYFFAICEKHHPASRKQKWAWGNHLPYIKKTLSKEVMKRKCLRNKFLKDTIKRNIQLLCTSCQKIKKCIVILIKGAMELYFMHYSCVDIILFITGLYKSAFSTDSFGKLVFCFSELFALCQKLFKHYSICIT